MKLDDGQTLCETEHFIKVASALWSDTELDLLKDFIAFNPEVGDEMPGTGGLRKLRWSRAGMGKRGGARVIYYFYNHSAPIYLLHAYKKAAKDDLTPLEKASLTKMVDILKARLKQKE